MSVANGGSACAGGIAICLLILRQTARVDPWGFDFDDKRARALGCPLLTGNRSSNTNDAKVAVAAAPAAPAVVAV